jgi:hypothetical protein
MCLAWISEQTEIISLYSINLFVFITETESVYCAVWTGSLNQTATVSSLKGWLVVRNWIFKWGFFGLGSRVDCYQYFTGICRLHFHGTAVFYPKQGPSRFLSNVDAYFPENTASYHKSHCRGNTQVNKNIGCHLIFKIMSDLIEILVDKFLFKFIIEKSRARTSWHSM